MAGDRLIAKTSRRYPTVRLSFTNCAFTLIIRVIVESWACPAAQAAEGASSNYTPGTYGNLAVAMQPPPGSFAVINYLGYVSSDIDRAVLNNRAATNVDTKQVFVAPLGLYTFKTPVLGGALFSVGGWLAFPWASLDTTLTTAGGSAQSSQTNVGIGQSGLIPAYLSWKLGGNFSFAAYEAIYIPTGSYSTSNPLNLNRGYWSFDTNVALTWFNEQSGTELSATAGLMANTVNPHTDYQTGTEFHLEYVLNQFVTKVLSVGLHGYYYDQVTNDRLNPSTTAALNVLNLSASDLRSRAHGLGPQVNWIVNDRLIFSFSWIHDLYTHYRMASDYFYLNTYITF
jgi:hypothetical protein